MPPLSVMECGFLSIKYSISYANLLIKLIMRCIIKNNKDIHLLFALCSCPWLNFWGSCHLYRRGHLESLGKFPDTYPKARRVLSGCRWFFDKSYWFYWASKGHSKSIDGSQSLWISLKTELGCQSLWEI